MKHRFSKFIVLIAVLSLLASSAAAFAQGTEPREPIPFERPGFGVMVGERAQVEDLRYERPGKAALADLDAAALNADSAPEAPEVTVGEPGVTYSHVDTFGHADSAYMVDTNHFVYPYGVGTVGTSVWIADSEGNRALKYDGGGIWQQTIGNAGYLYLDEDGNYPMCYITDVTVDNESEVWLVDACAGYLLEFTAAGVLTDTLGVPWEGGAGEYTFDQPRSVAFDTNGNIYVSDHWNHRINIYNSAKEFITTLGSFGTGNFNFNRPEHITIFGTTLYVADSRNHRVQMFNISNPAAITHAGSFGSQGDGDYQFNRPLGVAVNNTYVFVADANNHRVQVYNRVSGVYANTIGHNGSGDGEFGYPSDVALDAAGNIFVADNWNQRVIKFTSGFGLSRNYGSTGVPYLTDDTYYHAPSGVAVEPDGEIVISEGEGNRIVKIKPDGTPVWTFGSAGICDNTNATLCGPQDVDVAPDGKIYVSDTWNNRVVVLSSAGAFQTAFGTYGELDGEFDGAYAAALDNTNNLIYVVDRNNHRVQAFNRTTLAFVAKFGSYGTGNGQFRTPEDIAIDSTGQIYVVDRDNHRVQVFNSSRVWVRSIGVYDNPSDAYNRLRYPVAVAIGPKDRVFIATNWGGKIKVYDKNGLFLDCIDNGWESFQGMFRTVRGLGTDAIGNLYTTDEEAHQLKRFAPAAYPGWRQVNTTGFGEHSNWAAWSMTVYSDTLYVSSSPYYDIGAKLYKLENGNFTQVMSGGFGELNNVAIDAFEVFSNTLYAGTWNEGSGGTQGGQIWRTDEPDIGSWEKVVSGGFDSAENGEVMALRTFGDYLYAGTYSYDNADPEATIWRSDTGDLNDWDKVFSKATPGFHHAVAVLDMVVFHNLLWAATFNREDGAEIWFTGDGTTWFQANTDGFGDAGNTGILSLAVFNGELYAGTQNIDYDTKLTYGGEIWRLGEAPVAAAPTVMTWSQVMEGGFGDVYNWGISGLVEYRNELYAITTNEYKGQEVWRSATGDLDSWEQVGAHSFGKEWVSAFTQWNNNHAVYQDVLYVATHRVWGIGGGRVWSFMPDTIYLPLIVK